MEHTFSWPFALRQDRTSCRQGTFTGRHHGSGPTRRANESLLNFPYPEELLWSRDSYFEFLWVVGSPSRYPRDKAHKGRPQAFFFVFVSLVSPGPEERPVNLASSTG